MCRCYYLHHLAFSVIRWQIYCNTVYIHRQKCHIHFRPTHKENRVMFYTECKLYHCHRHTKIVYPQTDVNTTKECFTKIMFLTQSRILYYLCSYVFMYRYHNPFSTLPLTPHPCLLPTVTTRVHKNIRPRNDRRISIATSIHLPIKLSSAFFSIAN